ncbi:hypothetical protein [Krasilnikovia sp. M28-CT-15]|uniref:hypothetical protein n=1 Tax=Krasilnikovia sp. M28-CT-15 TaxID=3373540 RepID=UPI003877584B
MTHLEEQLREAFEAHEHPTPDPGAVYARVQQLSRTYRRRRRGAQAAGGAVLGAGLIAGAINLPTFLPGRPADGVSVVMPAAAPSVSVSASTVPSEAELQREFDAYFAAGYDYDDAVKLAKLWKSTADVGTVKAEAGRRLLAGQTLPFPPTPGGAVSTTPPSREQKQLDAYFGAGYDYNDAVQLAKLWHLPDPYAAKVAAGKRVLAGQHLPIKPDPKNVSDARITKQYDAFFAAGYDYDDAVQLAKLWHLASPSDAKAVAGKKLLAGETLPIKP